MSRRPRRAPLYARTLRLRYVPLGSLMCFLCFEGAMVLGSLLALAEFAPWRGALVLPAAVAVAVKVSDVVAGLSMRSRRGGGAAAGRSGAAGGG